MRSHPVPPPPGQRRPSRGVLLATAVLGAGPVALAFWSGGYFDGPREIALFGLAAVLVVLAVTTAGADLVPRSAGGRAALLGFVLLTGWIWLSGERSALPDVASDDAQRVLLYSGFLVAGAVVWRRRETARLAEPVVAAGVLVVVLYGLAGRWLPGIVHLEATASAGGRLEQPLTYWNAVGMLAAVGAILCIRLAGDPERAARLRTAAAASAVPLLCGLYLSFSRGALAAMLSGLIVLALCAPTAVQLRAAAVTLVAGAVAVAASALLPGVRALEGSSGARELDGLVALGVTLIAMGAAAALTARAARGEARTGRAPVTFRVPRAGRWLAVGAILLVVVGPVVASRGGSDLGRKGSQPSFGASTQRFTTIKSNRYAYWRVALHSFREHPLAGVGSGGWAAEWLQQRKIIEGARDAHSIELEALAELGLVGFALLLLAFGGVAKCAAAVQRRDPGLAAGACAGLTVWVAHSALDWDWEMPAATLPVLTLAAVLVARADAGTPAPAPAEEVVEPAGSIAVEPAR